MYITGHVQGVYFRASLRAEAEKLGVKGWARNLPDGRVEAVLEGNEFATDQIVIWCRRGPAGAQVRHVEIIAESLENLGSFKVLR